MTELDKLEAYLKERSIDYERIDQNAEFDEEGFVLVTDRHQINVFSKSGHKIWDAICQRGSYGYRQGLLEVMGNPVVRREDGDRVRGCLTAQDVIDRLEGKA